MAVEIKQANAGRFEEVGTPGLNAYAGYINEAYASDLYWPQVSALYTKVWRSDPEVSIVRLLWETWSAQQSYEVEMPEEVAVGSDKKPTDDDKKARDFYAEVLDDLEGGFNSWLTACITRVPFFGWGWWEVPIGMRSSGWKTPGGDDDWRSDYDDGLVGYRRTAFRRYSSFQRWDMNDETGRVTGLAQSDPPRKEIVIPSSRSLHVKFGDSDNPEGLALLEALWRLERYKYNLELIQGIGFEHSAGHAYFKATKKLDDDDNALIRRSARAVLTAQEGNYISLPEHIDFRLVDVPFQAGPSILQALRYYSILKLAVLGMQWVAMSTIAGVGSFSAVQDASQMALMAYNSMVEGFCRAFDDQLGRRLFGYPANKAAFPDMSRFPRIKVKRVEKKLSLTEIGAFGQALATFMPLGADDMIALRKATGVLPETMPPTVINAPPPEEGEGGAEETAPETPGGEMELSLELAEGSDGVMVALFLPPEVAAKYVQDVDGALPADKLHLTLAYLGDTDNVSRSRRELLSNVQRFASSIAPIKAKINGYGRFTDTHMDGKDAVWLSVDAPNLPEIRQRLVQGLKSAGFKVPSDHGFTPHITLAYVDPDKRVEMPFEPSEVTFEKLWAAWGEEANSFGMYGAEDPLGDPNVASEMAFRPFAVSDQEEPVGLDHLGDVSDADVRSALREFEKWAEENDPRLAGLLASPVDGG